MSKSVKKNTGTSVDVLYEEDPTNEKLLKNIEFIFKNLSYDSRQFIIFVAEEADKQANAHQ